MVTVFIGTGDGRDPVSSHPVHPPPLPLQSCSACAFSRTTSKLLWKCSAFLVRVCVPCIQIWKQLLPVSPFLHSCPFSSSLPSCSFFSRHKLSLFDYPGVFFLSPSLVLCKGSAQLGRATLQIQAA